MRLVLALVLAAAGGCASSYAPRVAADPVTGQRTATIGLRAYEERCTLGGSASGASLAPRPRVELELRTAADSGALLVVRYASEALLGLSETEPALARGARLYPLPPAARSGLALDRYGTGNPTGRIAEWGAYAVTAATLAALAREVPDGHAAMLRLTGTQGSCDVLISHDDLQHAARFAAEYLTP